MLFLSRCEAHPGATACPTAPSSHRAVQLRSARGSKPGSLTVAFCRRSFDGAQEGSGAMQLQPEAGHRLHGARADQPLPPQPLLSGLGRQADLHPPQLPSLSPHRRHIHPIPPQTCPESLGQGRSAGSRQAAAASTRQHG